MTALTQDQKRKLAESEFQTAEDVLDYLLKQRRDRLFAISEIASLVTRPGVNQKATLVTGHRLAVENDLLSEIIDKIIG